MTLNHANDTIYLAPGVRIPFDVLRKYLLTYHQQLCKQNFIKAIKTPAGLLFTYDWDNIFFVVSSSPLLEKEFLTYLNRTK